MINWALRSTRRFFSGDVQDTIYAVASGASRSPVSIIRVGGSLAYKTLLLTLPQGVSGTDQHKEQVIKAAQIKRRMAHLRSVYSQSKQLIDKSMVIYFPSDSSYNGEDIVELHVHGSRAVIKAIFQELKRLGFRMAERGQFTKRAILNNKMDCLQAQGIHELIMSDSQFSRKVALNHLMGQTSKQINEVRDELVSCLAASEAFIDFPGEEEDIKEELMEKTRKRVHKIMGQLEASIKNRRQVELLTEGLQVTIVGKPNAGKSTLINKIVKKEVAIVSDIPGTTRDLINASVEHRGIVVHLTDTAGLRETTEVIEREGIKRALAKSKQGHISLFLIDPTVERLEQDWIDLGEVSAADQQILSDPKTLLIVNKADRITLQPPIEIRTKKGLLRHCTLLISALEEDNLDRVLDRILDQANAQYKFESFQTQMLLTKQRHYQSLKDCLQHLRGYTNTSLPVDIRCEQLRQAITHIGSITGRIDTEQVLDVLFRDFCIGK